MRIQQRSHGCQRLLDRSRHDLRAVIRAMVFVVAVLPMLPAGIINRLTGSPKRLNVTYPGSYGPVDAELWIPSGNGPHPGVVLNLGVIPLDYDHPQLERLQNALARAGFVTLVHWSPAMRAFRLEPNEVADVATAYGWLLDQPSVDPNRSGMIGTCVGGSFAMLAAADDRIRDKISFLAVFAPYGSMRSLARDIASASQWRQGKSCLGCRSVVTPSVRRVDARGPRPD